MEHVSMGKRQRMILKCFWNAGGKMTVPEIQEALKNDYDAPLSRSAINTMVKILIDKGFLRLSQKMRYAYIYEVTMNQEEYQLYELNYLKNEVFEGNFTKLLVGFAQTSATEEELAEVKKMLEEVE